MSLGPQYLHTFYIPVMGTGFTIDAPLKVAPYGISSVISLVDDFLMERIREYYCGIFREQFIPIKADDPDCRARRITEYLNFVHRHVQRKFNHLRSQDFEHGSEIHKYFQFLPDTSKIKQLYQRMISVTRQAERQELEDQLRNAMRVGSIDVNIMTKLDTPARTAGTTAIMDDHSSALAALRGFAQSQLNSAIVFSAGVNQRLYSYAAEFKDFYADSVGQARKKIILKVKDFRSALTQGKFLAKKGLWVSAFRVESGLNCGGHAFGGQGSLLGPVLEEFKNKRTLLVDTLKGIYQKAIKNLTDQDAGQCPSTTIQVQGGIGTAEEDTFLREYYKVDSTGWATPFLFCPEVSNLDDETLQSLIQADAQDIVLSGTSPLGIPFHTLTTSSAEREKRRRVQAGEQGIDCVKGLLRLNNEFGRFLCPASKAYQKLKFEALQRADLSEESRELAVRLLQEKDCICHQLGNGVMKKYGLSIQGPANVQVCPGPDGTHFTRIVTLQEMVDHIYGRNNILQRPRPHMFVYELGLNIDFLKAAVALVCKKCTIHVEVNEFQKIFRNLLAGIDYYCDLLDKGIWIPSNPDEIRAELDRMSEVLRVFEQKHLLPAS